MATFEMAQNLASMGRNGDSMLMHVQPREVAGLQALAQANGTTLTTNPDTGMPEAFNLGGVLEAALPIAAGAFLGPAGAGIGGGFFTGANAALMSGLTVGALTTVLSGGDLGKGLMSGLGAYGGAGLGGNLASAGAKESIAQTAANTTKDAFQAGNIGASYLPPSTAQIGGANLTSPIGSVGQVGSTGQLGPTMGQVNTFAQPTQMNNQIVDQISRPADLGVSAPRTGFENAMTGAKNLFSPEGFQAFKDAGGSGGQLAMMGGSALLGGLEEKDIYGNPIKPEGDVYDPYARLNLGGPSSEGESGLRLLASGGPVSFAKGGASMQGGGGASMQGGGSGAMQGADPIRISVPGAGNFPAASLMGSISKIAPIGLGLFADQSMIDAARERQNNALRSQTNLGIGLPYMGMGGMNQSYSGMGGMNQPYMGMGGINQPYMGMGGLGGLRSQNAEPTEDINSLNLGKQTSMKLATGGTIQSGGTMDLYGTSDNLVAPPISQDGYGVGRLDRLARTSADSSAGQYQFAQGGYLDGAGDGMSDSIPATIEGKQPARLADGEFVIPADVVSHLGNGSTKAGAKQLYKMLDKIRSARTGTKKQGKQINPSKYMPA